MARRTTNRQAFSVPTGSKNYPTQAIYTQAEFKGLCDNKNEIVTNQNSFADLKNILVDYDNLLVSRPPVKVLNMTDDNVNILKDWRFGNYHLRLYKEYMYGDEVITTPGTHTLSEITFRFTIKCVSHTLVGEKTSWSWTESASKSNDLFHEPEVFCAAIENKIFIWYDKIDFIALNISASTFEDARKYLYLPITSTVVNGIITPTESKNILTDSSRTRYEYGLTSTLPVDDLIDSNVSVSYKDNFLYNIDYADGAQVCLIVPKGETSPTVIYDTVTTSAATVYLRYNYVTNSLGISYDGIYYSLVDVPDNIYGRPMLYRDGTGLAIFTDDNIRLYSLTNGTWTLLSYPTITGITGKVFSNTLIPQGVFFTNEFYAYVIKATDGNQYYCYSYYNSTDKKVVTGSQQIKITRGTPEVTTTNVIKNNTYRFNALQITDNVPLAVIFGDDIDTGRNVYGNNIIVLDGKNIATTAFYYTIGQNSYSQPFKHSQHGDIWLQSIGNNAGTLEYIARIATCADQYVYFGDTQKYGYAPNYLILNLSIQQAKSETATTLSASITSSSFSSLYTALTYPVQDLRGRAILSPDGNLATFPRYFWTADNGWFHSPVNHRLSEHITERKRLLNGDRLTWQVTDEEGNISYPTYCIHRVTSDGTSLSNDEIVNGCPVVLQFEECCDARDWLLPGSSSTGVTMNRYYVSDGGEVGAPIYIDRAENITLTRFTTNVTLPVGAPGNDTDTSLIITGSQSTQSIQNPLLYRRILPLYTQNNGSSVGLSNMLWSAVPDKDFVDLDIINDAISADGTYVGRLRPIIPTHEARMTEEVFSFADAENYITVAQTKRRDDTTFLLYLPEANVQRFTNEITNLHRLSDTQIGIFTDDETWYINTLSVSDNVTGYTLPIKTRLNLGCRNGTDILTAFSGQMILVPTSRGIAAISPQAFVATTDQSVDYLTDAVSDFYDHFYTEAVEYTAQAKMIGADILPNYLSPRIKICAYEDYLFFYRQYDSISLMYDTRSNTWWKLNFNYPIRQMIADNELLFLFEIDFSPVVYEDDKTTLAALPKVLSKNGVIFQWLDSKYRLRYKHLGNEFFVSMIDDIDAYVDSTITINNMPALSGRTEAKTLQTDNLGNTKEKRILLYGEKYIDWHLVSQRLHFGVINNWKSVQGLNIIAHDNATENNAVNQSSVRVETRAFRDIAHPERSETTDFEINDLRTIVLKFNILHVTNFQYSLVNVRTENPRPLRLDSISIKYQVKEIIR